MKSVISWILFIFVISAEVSYSKIIRRYFYTGFLHEGFGHNSPKIDYADTSPDEWKDLKSLTKKYGLKKKSMFCTNGIGVWISYPKVNFHHDSRFFDLIVGEQCVSADTTGSIQPVGYIFGTQQSAVSVFKSLNLASKASIVTKGTKKGNYKSMIYVGTEPWTLEGTGKMGKKSLCLVRDKSRGTVCVLPNLEMEFGFTGSISVKKDCAKDVGHYYMQNCFSEGTHKMDKQLHIDSLLMKGFCKSGSKASKGRTVGSSTGFGDIIGQFFALRMWYEAEEYGTVPPMNPAVQYKADFLMEFLDIFSLSCPRVSPMYISLLGNAALLHLNEFWRKFPDAIGTPDGHWTEAWDFLQQCGAVVSTGMSQTHANVLDAMSFPCEPSDPGDYANPHEELAMEMMFQGDRFDPIIEQVWLILNFVAPFCSHIQSYRDNLWSDFPSMFKKHFLIPLEKQWLHPGEWSKMYQFMFNGFDMESQHQGILACVQSAVHSTPFLDPVGRTQIFDAVFYPWTVKKGNSSSTGVDEVSPPDGDTDTADKDDEPSAGRSVVFRPGKKHGRKIKGRTSQKGKSIRKKQKRGRKMGKAHRQRGKKMGRGMKGKKGKGRKMGKHGKKGRGMDSKPGTISTTTGQPKEETAQIPQTVSPVVEPPTIPTIEG